MACGGGPAPSEPAAAPGATATASTPTASAQQDDEPLPEVGSPYDALPEGARGLLDQAFTGDLDAMVKRRIVRAGVTFNRTHYFIDRGQQRGVAYESLMNFEEALNSHLKTGNLKVHVAIVPLPRDMLLPALIEGKVDLDSRAAHGDPRTGEAGGLHDSHAPQRQRDCGHRPGRPGRQHR